MLTNSGYYLYQSSDRTDVFVVKHAQSLPHVSASLPSPLFFPSGKSGELEFVAVSSLCPIKVLFKRKKVEITGLGLMPAGLRSVLLKK